MAGRPRYLLDANALIEAKRHYYRFRLCPGFWECLCWHHKQGELASIDRVKEEIDRGKDDLSHWAKTSCPRSFFSTTTHPDIGNWFGRAMVWVQSQSRYIQAAREKFAVGADGWLIACARQSGMIVVTHETLRPDSRKEVKIPDVCDALGVRYLNTFEMLETLDARFDWAKGGGLA